AARPRSAATSRRATSRRTRRTIRPDSALSQRRGKSVSVHSRRVAAVGLGLLALLPAAAGAQAPVTYEVRFPNAVHHEAEITVTFADVPAGALEVRMSRSSPG